MVRLSARLQRTSRVALLLAAALPGCADPAPADARGETDAPDTDGEPEPEDAETGRSTGMESELGESSSSTRGEESTSTGIEEEPEPGPALVIDALVANQGVGVDIAVDGAVIDVDQRSVTLVAHRPTLVRATWSRPDDWVPREVEARLVLTQSDGSQETIEDAMFVDGEADLATLEGTFRWVLGPNQLQPGVEYRVELGDEDAPEASFPADGSVALGVPSGDMAMHVVVVPFQYDDGEGCSTLADTSASTLQALHDHLYQQNPLSSLTFEVREPLAFAGDTEHLAAPLSELVTHRFADGAAPQTYYYGLIDTCAPADFTGVTGMAAGIPTDPWASDAPSGRTAIGRWLGEEQTAQIFVHEMGHCMGRHHVACAVPAGGPDPSYPDHPNGRVLDQGYGVLDGQLRDPELSDYMTYCPSQWVGEFGWNMTRATIEALNEMLAADAPTGLLLHGLIAGDGEAYWSIIPGTMSADSGDADISIEVDVAGTTVTSSARARLVPDSDAYVVTAALPDSADADMTLAWIDNGVRREIAPGKIRDFRELGQ